MKVRVQTEDFDLNAECRAIRSQQIEVGALVSFVGLVRAQGCEPNAYSLELEHYPQMTEKVITDMVEQAIERFSLQDATVIHRVGRLDVGDQIVLVVTIAPHRRAAFEGCEFIMDFLKTQAPFWKKENACQQSNWVDAKESDDQALRRWGKNSQNAK